MSEETNETDVEEPRKKWAYAYELDPAVPEDRLNAIRGILDHEREAARNGARTWASHLVTEEQVTHILVVSDTPRQNLEANRRLEQKLRDLKARFFLTAPMAVDGNSASPPEDSDADE